MTDTAARARQRVELVRDNTAERLALAQDFYHADPGRFRRYGHAELSFMRWSAARGVLEPESSDPAGSPWWRSVNGMLLRDKVEASLLATDTSGNASNRSVQYWLDFIRQPSPTRWYRAHNASIVAGYLTYEGLAAQEIKVERFMMNVALIRVLYTHAMLANPRLALGPLAFLGPRLVDPRHRSVKSFLDLGRSFPREYPVPGPVEEVVLAEHALARMLDYGLIAPRLPLLYEFAATALEEPRLTSLLDAGVPAYVWPHADRAVWFVGNTGPHLRAIARMTGVRLLWEPSPFRRPYPKARG
ncbi:hypothetical protein ABT121_19800 [Streptomyces sp. NPDC001928]|uniref:hypothetical protein n=1 Tax=Streptomyces sp. NPDC001928 TaxID=3154404 RepID=UPI00332F3E07